MGEKTTTGALQKKANSLYKIEADKLSAVQSIFTKDQLQILHKATPEEHIHHFPANAGAMAGLSFVTGGYMKHMLDRLTGGMWSFEVKEKGNTSGQVWVLGRLTLYKSDGSPLVFKEQFGRAAIKYKRSRNGEPSDQPLDIGNDMKAAATDGLKKCASELGIARDIYAANEFIEVEIIDKADVEDMPEQQTQAATPQKVDDAYKKYVNDLLLEIYPKTYDRMQFVKNVTNKISMDKLTDFEWQFVCGELESQKLSKVDI